MNYLDPATILFVKAQVCIRCFKLSSYALLYEGIILSFTKQNKLFSMTYLK